MRPLEPVPAIVESQYQEFRQLDQRVDDAEGEGLRARWEFGLKMLRDRKGETELSLELGKPGKRAEFGHRKRFAVRCPTEGDFANAVSNHGSWHQVISKVLPTDRATKNAAGAHEGTELSEADARGEGWQLLLGDMRDRLPQMPDAAVDLIVTDPPYPAEYLPLWKQLAEQAERLLCPGGVLVARCSHLFIPDVLAMLGEHLSFGWLYAEPLPGSNVRFMGRHVAVAWQPWVAFSKGPWPSGRLDWHPDMLTESPRTKQRYVWEQKWDVAAELTATFATPGLDVLDPFAGSGTYGVAALTVGCRWTGVEVDPAGHASAATRLAQVAA